MVCQAFWENKLEGELDFTSKEAPLSFTSADSRGKTQTSPGEEEVILGSQCFNLVALTMSLGVWAGILHYFLKFWL